MVQVIYSSMIPKNPLSFLSISRSYNELVSQRDSPLKILDFFRVLAIIWVIANHTGSEGRIDILDRAPSAEGFKVIIIRKKAEENDELSASHPRSPCLRCSAGQLSSRSGDLPRPVGSSGRLFLASSPLFSFLLSLQEVHRPPCGSLGAVSDHLHHFRLWSRDERYFAEVRKWISSLDPILEIPPSIYFSFFSFCNRIGLLVKYISPSLAFLMTYTPANYASNRILYRVRSRLAALADRHK